VGREVEDSGAAKDVGNGVEDGLHFVNFAIRIACAYVANPAVHSPGPVNTLLALRVTEEFEGQVGEVFRDEETGRSSTLLSRSGGGDVSLFVAEDGKPDGRREQLDDDGGRGRRLRRGARGGRGLGIGPGFGAINFVDALRHGGDGVNLLLVFGSS
jgi:hypothetical protein